MHTGYPQIGHVYNTGDVNYPELTIVKGPAPSIRGQKTDKTQMVVTARCPDCTGNIEFNIHQLGESAGDKQYRRLVIKNHTKNKSHKDAVNGVCPPCVDEGDTVPQIRTDPGPFYVEVRLPLDTNVLLQLARVVDADVAQFVPNLRTDESGRFCLILREPNETYIAVRLLFPDIIVNKEQFTLMRKSIIHACARHDWEGALGPHASNPVAWDNSNINKEGAILQWRTTKLERAKLISVLADGQVNEEALEFYREEPAEMESTTTVQCAPGTETTAEWKRYLGCPSIKPVAGERRPPPKAGEVWIPGTPEQVDCIRSTVLPMFIQHLLDRGYDVPADMYQNTILHVARKVPEKFKFTVGMQVSMMIHVRMEGEGSSFCYYTKRDDPNHTMQLLIFKKVGREYTEYFAKFVCSGCKPRMKWHQGKKISAKDGTQLEDQVQFKREYLQDLPAGPHPFNKECDNPEYGIVRLEKPLPQALGMERKAGFDERFDQRDPMFVERDATNGSNGSIDDLEFLRQMGLDVGDGPDPAEKEEKKRAFIARENTAVAPPKVVLMPPKAATDEGSSSNSHLVPTDLKQANKKPRVA